MLSEFLIQNQVPIIAQCESEILRFGSSRGSTCLPENGWHIFYDQLIAILQRDQPMEFQAQTGVRIEGAAQRGKEYLRMGYTVSDVVQSYGVLCRSITEFASKLGIEITPREFWHLNVSLDTAISESVSEYEKSKFETRDFEETERLGFLAHELRNSLQSATVAMEMLEGGNYGPRSNTSSLLQTSLHRMAELIDTALTQVRIEATPLVRLEKLRAYEIMSEVAMTAGYIARKRNIIVQMQGTSDLELIADRQLIVSALANIVQNALKYTPTGGMVKIRAVLKRKHVHIEVEDQCGGLSNEVADALFKPFIQNSDDRTGLGLGLTISRRAIELCHGILRVENLPRKGCTFIIELPNARPDRDTLATEQELRCIDDRFEEKSIP